MNLMTENLSTNISNKHTILGCFWYKHKSDIESTSSFINNTFRGNKNRITLYVRIENAHCVEKDPP